jgi:polysaccharide deacetylase family protein (PEP-CTERM system associated)
MGSIELSKVKLKEPTSMLTVDLEDWNQLMHRRHTGELIPPTGLVVRQTKQLLEILERHSIRATFFVLGFVAEKFPNLVREIHSQGHEIASHSFSHRLTSSLTPEQFKEDVKRSLFLLEDLVGEKVIGFRSPEFSVSERNLSSLEKLVELGIRYDSSIFPIRHRRYGYRDFSRAPTKIEFGGNSILEIPLSTLSIFGARLPVAGGGYFRLFPSFFLSWALKTINHEGLPLNLYFHPYEFSDEFLDLALTYPEVGAGKKLRTNFLQNLGRKSIPRKLDKLLPQHSFVTCREVLNAIQ